MKYNTYSKMYICEVNIINLSDNCGHFTFSWQFSFPCYSRDLWTCPCAPWRRRPRCWWGPPCCLWSCPGWRCAGLWRHRGRDTAWTDWPGGSTVADPGGCWSCRYGALEETINWWQLALTHYTVMITNIRFLERGESLPGDVSPPI